MTRRILAIDPGPEQSAWLVLDDETPRCFGIVPNAELRDMLRGVPLADVVVIEMVASYGMPVGESVFETCVWIGRYIEASLPQRAERLFRKDVKMTLCQSMRAKDSNIRQALIDRYGGTRETAIGKKATPGPLYGIAKDVWAALAVAVTWRERMEMAGLS